MIEREIHVKVTEKWDQVKYGLWKIDHTITAFDKWISLTAKVGFLAFKKVFCKLQTGEKIEKEKKIGGSEN